MQGKPNLLIYSRSMEGSRANFYGNRRVDKLIKSLSHYANVDFSNKPNVRDVNFDSVNICVYDFFDFDNGPDENLIDEGLEMITDNPETQFIVLPHFNKSTPQDYSCANLVLQSYSISQLADALILGHQINKKFNPVEFGVGGMEEKCETFYPAVISPPSRIIGEGCEFTHNEIAGIANGYRDRGSSMDVSNQQVNSLNRASVIKATQDLNSLANFINDYSR